MSEIRAWAKLRGIRIYMYLDIWLVVHKDPYVLQEQLNLLLQQVTKLGLLVNQEKSVVTPSQGFIFLGMHFDTERGTVAPNMKWWQKTPPR